MLKVYVYFIKERLGIHAPVKIGYARNVQHRFNGIQIGNPRSLEIIATIGPVTLKQARAIESGLHKKFKKHHIRGEWFSGVILSKMNQINEDIVYDQPEILELTR